MRDRPCKWNEFPKTFEPIAYTGEAENAARAAGWTVLHLSPMESGPRPWFQRAAPSGDSSTPRLYLSAGIHGDEISGPLALLEMMRQPDSFDAFDVTMFPILNPNGLASGRTGTKSTSTAITETLDHSKRRATSRLTLGRFEASMMLQEDYEGIGAYLYELNDTLDPGLGAKIIAAMGLHVPVDLRPEIDEAVARGVVISRRDLISKLGRLEDRPEWSEATYLTVYHTEVSYTIETPKPFPIKARVKASGPS